MKARALAGFAAGATLLTGCASKGARENLSACRWEVVSFAMGERSGATVQGTAKVRLQNPTDKVAILDSLWADVATKGGALARLSHGRTVELAPGKADTVELHLQADPSQLGMRLMEMLFAAPDSLLVSGQARVPLLGGLVHADKAFRTRVPAANLMGVLGSALRAPGPAADTALEPDEP